MKKHHRIYSLGLILTGLTLLAGCASTGPSDAALSGDPVAMWDDGKIAVERGEKIVKKADEKLSDGRKLVREGEAKIDQGNIDTLRARQEYQTAARSSGQSASPEELAKEVKRLKKIGAQWEDAIDDIKDGNKLVAKGNKIIDDAQSDIRQGRALMESGSTMMRNSQRLRMGEGQLPMPEQMPSDSRH